ncbi:hypothetical protein GCM10009678_84750 [Actinomadura kijaniata]|uniref:Uncharacterized protein n=1 Tax=Actinomadura namibiensis TaxID=182080 RepID=A0A7W3QSQ9_ACTNM|nr:hypothetical protein [Actinomadura namibiensis]MBA8957643.1 hypothetical protein [Actinomadura namibiensis]
MAGGSQSSAQTALQEVVEDTERLRRRVRGDRHASSVPLLVFGGLTFIGAVLVSDPGSWDAYWLLAGPSGFLGTWLWYSRQESQTGVGRGRGSYLPLGVAVLLAVLFVPLGFVAPIPAAGLGLAVIAIRQRNGHLGLWAVMFASIGWLEGRYFISNKLDELTDSAGYAFGHLDRSGHAVFALTGLALLAGGGVALWKENRR